MKYLLIIVAVFLVSPSFGQDTLFYKSGKQVLGRVIEIDSPRMKMVYRQLTGETKVILMSTLVRVGFDSTEEINYTNSHVVAEIQELPPPAQNTPHFILATPGNYTYGKLMVFFNPFGLVRKQSGFPANSTLATGAEYLPGEHFGINGGVRLGLGYYNPPNDTNAYIVNETNETIYEISILPKIYPFGQKKFAWYIAPVFSFGKVWRYHHKSFSYYTISEESGERDHFADHKSLLEKSRDHFSTFGGATGIQFNVARRLTASAQLLIISTDAISTYYTAYSNYRRDDWFVEFGNNIAYRQTHTPFQISLVYRFKGVRNHPD